jgi:hypothetical protein
LEKWSGQLSAYYDSGRNSGGDKTMSIVTKAFALAGVIWTFGLALGLALDIRDFDRTRGGYKPPYEDVIGEPIDWASLDLTRTGLVKGGYVVNTHVNATTGMISFEIFKQMIDFRPLSDRAIHVHKPREAFIERGFRPEF